MWTQDTNGFNASKISNFHLTRAFMKINIRRLEIRSISQYSVRMRENTDQNNSEYGHFLRSDYL